VRFSAGQATTDIAMKKAKTRIIRFLETEIWRLDKSDLPTVRALLLKPMRVLLLTVQGYVRDDCALRASALTFYSLLAVVPVAAMAFGIAKGFGLEQRLEKMFYQQLAGQEVVVDKIITFARSLLANTQGGLIAGIGVVLLFWSAVKVLNHIEGTLNDIWKVQSRSFVRKFTDYLAILVIGPLLVILSSSINLFIMAQVEAITGRLALLKIASPVIFVMLRWLSFALTWLLFILIYIVLPNTRVRFSSALLAGIFAGTLFQITQWAYIHLQVLLSNYNAIYGSFAALPFFLIWMYFSWMIVLMGAQFAYAHQHVDAYAMQIDFQEMNVRTRKSHALTVLRLIVSNFENGGPPLPIREIAERLAWPSGLVALLIDQLVNSNIVSAVEMETAEEIGYQPARDIHGITVADVLLPMGDATREERPVPAGHGVERMMDVLDNLEQEIRKSPTNRLVKDL